MRDSSSWPQPMATLTTPSRCSAFARSVRRSCAPCARTASSTPSLSDVGTAAAVAVPICLAGNTIGCIVAGVTANPERLAITSRLSDRLKGWLPRHR